MLPYRLYNFNFLTTQLASIIFPDIKTDNQNKVALFFQRVKLIIKI